jgi:hypothetical protein
LCVEKADHQSGPPGRGAHALRVRERQIVLAEVDDVRADRQRDVQPIVDAERDARRAAQREQHARRGLERARRGRLGAQLQAAGTRRQQLRGARFELLAVAAAARASRRGSRSSRASSAPGMTYHYSVLPTPFRLQTELKPMGDQPRAIDEIYTRRAARRSDAGAAGHHGQRQDVHDGAGRPAAFSARRW